MGGWGDSVGGTAVHWPSVSDGAQPEPPYWEQSAWWGSNIRIRKKRENDV